MDINSLGVLISNVGFPIGLCLIFLYVFYKIGQALYQMWCNDVKPTLDSVKNSQIEFVETLKSLDCRVSDIETDVDSIKCDVSTIKNKLDIK